MLNNNEKISSKNFVKGHQKEQRQKNSQVKVLKQFQTPYQLTYKESFDLLRTSQYIFRLYFLQKENIADLYILKQMNIKSRKNLPQITNKRTRLQSKLHTYIENAVNCPDSQNKCLKEQFSKYGMDLFFYNLHEVVQSDMICSYKKNVFLENGVYILMQGKVTLVWNKQKNDRNRKEHLFNFAKTGVFSNLIIDPFKNVNQAFSQGFSMLVSDPFSILQCDNMSFMTMQESFLVKIPEPCLQLTKFYQLSNIRDEICEKARLPIEIYNTHTPLLSINTKLHHLFLIRRYYFHNKFQLNNYGVIQQGSVIFKNRVGSKIEGFKYHILFPEIDYEATSAQIKILEFNENPTLMFQNPLIVNLFLKQIKGSKLMNRSLVLQSLGQLKQTKKDSLFDRRILSPKKYLQSLQKLNETQLKKRRKNINSVSKDYENYFIIPTEICKESLKFAKTYNSQFPNQNKANNPRILFRYGHKKSETSPFNREPLQQIHKNKWKVNNLSLLHRYEQCSKDLYKKFMLTNNNIKNNK